jgi:hypothetical protein
MSKIIIRIILSIFIITIIGIGIKIGIANAQVQPRADLHDSVRSHLEVQNSTSVHV